MKITRVCFPRKRRKWRTLVVISHVEDDLVFVRVPGAGVHEPFGVVRSQVPDEMLQGVTSEPGTHYRHAYSYLDAPDGDVGQDAFGPEDFGFEQWEPA